MSSPVNIVQDAPGCLDSGIAHVAVIASAATAADVSLWAIRCATAGKPIFITKIWLQVWFNGTGAATEQRYCLRKGTGCTAMSGGAAVTSLIKRGYITNANVDARVLDTGLTQTGISQAAVFWSCGWARLTHSATQAGGISPQFTLDLSASPIELKHNEVLSIQNVVTAVIGDVLVGGVEFYGVA
jgi:hypothetical protein